MRLSHQLSLQNTDGKCCVSAGTGRPRRSVCGLQLGSRPTILAWRSCSLGASGEDAIMYLKTLAREVPHYWPNHGVHGPQALWYQEQVGTPVTSV